MGIEEIIVVEEFLGKCSEDLNRKTYVLFDHVESSGDYPRDIYSGY